ncbi:MAG: hypothetical protein IT446_15825 [Phycisphaerales bacterium]|nr:hypothetical protein [Phycisphaerales bacterium]
MKWKFEGADGVTGKNVRGVIDAPTQADAESKAQRRGILISSIRPDKTPILPTTMVDAAPETNKSGLGSPEPDSSADLLAIAHAAGGVQHADFAVPKLEYRMPATAAVPTGTIPPVLNAPIGYESYSNITRNANSVRFFAFIVAVVGWIFICLAVLILLAGMLGSTYVRGGLNINEAAMIFIPFLSFVISPAAIGVVLLAIAACMRLAASGFEGVRAIAERNR